MRILVEQPPIIDDARKVFRLPEGAIFTYGDVIYNPSGNLIDEPLMKHEEHHSKQQGERPELWWQRYLQDIDFRCSQEISAYQISYQSAKTFIRDRNKLHTYLMSLAMDLSGPMYGSIITFSEAYEAIKKPELFTFNV